MSNIDYHGHICLSLNDCLSFYYVYYVNDCEKNFTYDKPRLQWSQLLIYVTIESLIYSIYYCHNGELNFTYTKSQETICIVLNLNFSIKLYC